MQLRCVDTAEILFLWKLHKSKSRKGQYTFMLLLECWLSPSKSLSILLQKIGLRSADGVSADRGGLFAVFCRRVAKCIRVPRLSCFLCFSCTNFFAVEQFCALLYSRSSKREPAQRDFSCFVCPSLSCCTTGTENLIYSTAGSTAY